MHDFLAAAEARRNELVTLLQDLVRIDTRNRYCGDDDAPGEAAGQDYLEPILRELGAQTRRFDCPEDIYARMQVIGPAERDFRGRPNLVGEWRFGAGPRIIVNGHMDTVGTAGMTIALAAEATRRSGTAPAARAGWPWASRIRLLLDSGLTCGSLV